MQENKCNSYDEICYATMANIMTFSKGAERICLKGFDYTNEEHLFVLAVTVACHGILNGRDIAVDCDSSSRADLKKQYHDTCNIYKMRKKDTKFVDVAEILEYMRPTAVKLCGEDFSFGDIYREYYCPKGEW